MATSHTYLKKRKMGWYVQVAVPRELQPVLGKSPILRSLKTRDEAEAMRRRHAVIAQILAEFAEAAGQPLAPPATRILEAAQRKRAEVEEGRLDPEEAYRMHDVAVESFLEDQGRVHGFDSEGHPKLPPEDEASIRRSYSVLSGRHTRSLNHLVAVYLREQEKRLTAQTVGDKRRRLESFISWFGGERECKEVKRSTAGSYVTEVIQTRTQKTPGGGEEPLSAKTRGKEVSDLRSFFQWLEDRGHIDENPFLRMGRTVKESTRAAPETRRAWKASELSKVLHGVDANDPLWALTVIAAYTGMRREEVGELEVTSVQGSTLKVERGKTKAANRSVPIHPAIAPLVKQLAKTSTDGYLIPGLLRGGADNKRAWYVGKRFGRVIRQLGIDDPRLDFHALRGTVVAQLEEAGVPLSTIQLIVGHRRQGVTFSSYNPEGVSDKARREALQKVTFGKLDDYVATTGATVVVKESAKARKK